MLRRFVLATVGLLLLAIALGFAMAAEDRLFLPSDLEIIKTGAFEGSGAMYVVVPEGAKEIHARAFANSSLTRIDLPESLIFLRMTRLRVSAA